MECVIITTDTSEAHYLSLKEKGKQAHITVVYEIVNRIFWRLSLLVNANAEAEAVSILRKLIEFWKDGRIEDKSLLTLESEKRQRFIGGSEEIHLESHVLTQFEIALTQGLPKRRPSPWLAY